MLTYLHGMDRASRALPGLLGPFWFDADNGRPQAIRVGSFDRGQLDSAPLQIVGVSNPDPKEIESSEVFDIGLGRFGRIQQVVYTGIYLNEIPRLDVTQLTFDADFYFWFRFARDSGPGAVDPSEIVLPALVSGTFDRGAPGGDGRHAGRDRVSAVADARHLSQRFRFASLSV